MPSNSIIKKFTVKFNFSLHFLFWYGDYALAIRIYTLKVAINLILSQVYKFVQLSLFLILIYTYHHQLVSYATVADWLSYQRFSPNISQLTFHSQPLSKIFRMSSYVPAGIQKDKSWILLSCPHKSCPSDLSSLCKATVPGLTSPWRILGPGEWSTTGNCSPLLHRCPKRIEQVTIFIIKLPFLLSNTETPTPACMTLYWKAEMIYKRKYYTSEGREGEWMLSKTFTRLFRESTYSLLTTGSSMSCGSRLPYSPSENSCQTFPLVSPPISWRINSTQRESLNAQSTIDHQFFCYHSCIFLTYYSARV